METLDGQALILAGATSGGPGRWQDDPAETYHEASKLQPSLLRRQMAGVRRLERDRGLRRSVLRAGKRFTHRPTRPLPPPQFPEVTFESVLRHRHSSREFGRDRLSLATLSAVLFAAYGVTRRAEDRARPDLRAVPSAGALYPLDVYVAAQQVESLPAGLYHYDPGRHVLAELRRTDPRRALAPGLVEPTLADAPVIMMLAACFWRSRFKYGLRGYRFVLLEAGHLAQNIQLAAAALNVAALPVGGFFDRRIDEFLAIDGLHESTVYLLALGPGTADHDA